MRRTFDVDGQLRSAGERLEDDAVALGQLQQLFEGGWWRIRVEVEGQADGAEADRGLTLDAERATEVDIAK